MAIEFQCNSCSKTLRVQDKHAGRGVKCPECGAKLRVPRTDDDLFDDDEVFDDWGMEDDAAPPPPTRRPRASKPKQPRPRTFTESPPPRSVSSSGGGGELSAGDWFLIIFCSNIACIVGIVACLSGDTDRGIKLIVYPIVIGFGLGLVFGMLSVLMQAAGG